MLVVTAVVVLQVRNVSGYRLVAVVQVLEFLEEGFVFNVTLGSCTGYRLGYKFLCAGAREGIAAKFE